MFVSWNFLYIVLNNLIAIDSSMLSFTLWSSCYLSKILQIPFESSTTNWIDLSSWYVKVMQNNCPCEYRDIFFVILLWSPIDANSAALRVTPVRRHCFRKHLLIMNYWWKLSTCLTAISGHTVLKYSLVISISNLIVSSMITVVVYTLVSCGTRKKMIIQNVKYISNHFPIYLDVISFQSCLHAWINAINIFVLVRQVFCKDHFEMLWFFSSKFSNSVRNINQHRYRNIFSEKLKMELCDRSFQSSSYSIVLSSHFSLLVEFSMCLPAHTNLFALFGVSVEINIT